MVNFLMERCTKKGYFESISVKGVYTLILDHSTVKAIRRRMLQFSTTVYFLVDSHTKKSLDK